VGATVLKPGCCSQIASTIGASLEKQELGETNLSTDSLAITFSAVPVERLAEGVGAGDGWDEEGGMGGAAAWTCAGDNSL